MGFKTSSFRNAMGINNYFRPFQKDMSYMDCIEFVKGPASFMVGNSDPAESFIMWWLMGLWL